MKEKYIFRKIKREEIPQMFQLILQRIQWMNETGIKQWNVTKYDEVYPQSYYEEEWKKGAIFVLADRESGEIVCAAILRSQDERWEDEALALYVHNFVSKVGMHGAGTVFLELAESHALQNGKEFLRLDSARDNEKLARYYEEHGFCEAGVCEDGPYKGILRQKKLC